MKQRLSFNIGNMAVLPSRFNQHSVFFFILPSFLSGVCMCVMVSAICEFVQYYSELLKQLNLKIVVYTRIRLLSQFLHAHKCMSGAAWHTLFNVQLFVQFVSNLYNHFVYCITAACYSNFIKWIYY